MTETHTNPAVAPCSAAPHRLFTLTSPIQTSEATHFGDVLAVTSPSVTFVRAPHRRNELTGQIELPIATRVVS
jgi:hypothetical protein